MIINNNHVACTSYFYISSGEFFDGDTVDGCQRACNHMDISFGYPSIYDSGDKSLTMYFKATVPVRESHLAYPQSTLFAEIGGYTGLLLGFSLLDFTKVVNFFVDRMRSLGSHVSSKCSKKNFDAN